jgi:Ca2+-binding RTX toxin-like protein
MENLTGGAGADTFKFSPGGSVGGTVTDNGGVNALDYASYGSAVTVNLTTGAATGIGGGAAGKFTGIANVFGSSKADSLTGDANNNILVGNDGNDTITGGGGRDILIGGLGADSITGGADDDILIAGTTAYDANSPALVAIMAEWASADTYSVRINVLMNVGVMSGTVKLNTATVLTEPTKQVDTLTGAAGLDWFFAASSDNVTDKVNGETLTKL